MTTQTNDVIGRFWWIYIIWSPTEENLHGTNSRFVVCKELRTEVEDGEADLDWHAEVLMDYQVGEDGKVKPKFFMFDRFEVCDMGTEAQAKENAEGISYMAEEYAERQLKYYNSIGN